ncbi:MAG: hypothetical protein JST85_15805 [Acidobacteria bacterium]|nr:hypothetical protein [Acidobacteriota bacterium]
MQPQRPTSLLLNGRMDWRTRHARNVAVGANIRLAADPKGPLALASADGSLGGVVLPRGFAIDDEGRLYLLKLGRPWATDSHRSTWVKRFNPKTRKFAPLPTVADKVGPDARQVRLAANLAVARRNLYIADYGNRRVQVFDTETLMLRHIWPSPDKQRVWRPIDVATRGDAAYILDGGQGRVYKHRIGDDDLSLVVAALPVQGRWTRVAVDLAGRIHLLDLPKPGKGASPQPRIAVFDQQGQFIEFNTDANQFRARFEAPPIRLFRQDGTQLFCMPGSLARDCGRQLPASPPAPEMPLGLCAGAASDGLIFDRQGESATVNWDASAGEKLYATEGVWISQKLDSKISRCQWHRIELELGELPPGARIEVSTFAFEPSNLSDPEPDPREISENLWATSLAVTGSSQPANISATASSEESVVHSREGQYLWLRIKLSGDGYGSPAVNSIRLRFPRESYLNYLPAIYSADDESKRFLERFLGIVQTEWDELDRRIEEIEVLFDPKAVPGGAFLDYLANWLALPLEGNWDADQRRRLLKAAPKLYQQRGTLEGLRGYLQIYLQNMTGLSVEEQREYPQIVEGFRERQRFMLSVDNAAALGQGAPLWSQSVVGRLQLGVFAREGEVRLVSTGDPERDSFHEFAHRFRVFVPAAWVRTDTDEQMLRRAIEAEKPAHTSYDLCLIEPGFRVGLQSTVGIDAIVGAHATTRLGCTRRGDEGENRQPEHRLGFDTFLGGLPADQRAFQLDPDVQIGVDAILN